VPLLGLPAEREMGREEIGLLEVEPDPAIERGPADMRASRPSPAAKIQMMVLAVDPRLLLRAVPDAEIDPLMVPFGDGHPRRNFRRLLLRIQRFDVDELKELHPIEAPLRILYDAALIELARFEGELALDDVVAYALVPRD